MADVVMKMEAGEFEVVGEPTDAPEKVRKFPNVPPRMLEAARELELKKQELARQRKAAGDDYTLAMHKVRLKLCAELNALWTQIRDTQKVAVVAHRAKERLKQTEAAERKARFIGDAN